MDPAAILERFLDRPRVSFVRAVLDTYGRAAGGLLANGLAFSALFAVIPTVLLMLGLVGWLVGGEATQQALVDALVAVFPPLRGPARGDPRVDLERGCRRRRSSASSDSSGP